LAMKFTRPAPNQETVLACFQEDGWPLRIDNPLAGATHKEAHEKLRDAVKKLNHNQHLLAFHLDGTGEGVIWEILPSPSERRSDLGEGRFGERARMNHARSRESRK